jgi:acetyl esterase
MSTDLSIQPTHEVKISDVVYSQQHDFAWKARIFQPVGEGPFPTLLHVHGGAWTRGDRTRNAVLCATLAAHGVLVAAIDVHHPPVGGYPQAMGDVNVGARWLKALAPEYGGIDRIGAIGTSSGGHQAILLGMQPDHPDYSSLPGEPGVNAEIDYVVAIWPVVDPLARYQVVIDARNEDYTWAHEAFWGTKEAMADGSPQVLLDRNTPGLRTPPILIVGREVDKMHPRDMQEKFVASYREHGGKAEMVVLPNLPALFRNDESGKRMLAVMLPFIAEHSKLG